MYCINSAQSIKCTQKRPTSTGGKAACGPSGRVNFPRMETTPMALDYMPFWFAPWWKDYKVQALPRHVRLIFYDLLFTLWEKELWLNNQDDEVAYYLRITQEEWVDAKRILLKHKLIKLVQADKRISCDRLALCYEEIESSREQRKTAAKKRWQKHKETA